MSQENLILKPLRRVSPSRYAAMRSCLLREVWTAAGNEPLLPPSPLAELGSVIHELLEAAGRGQLEGRGNDTVDRAWADLVSRAEGRMMLSTLRRSQVPLSRSIPDYEVRRLRACHRAAEIAHDAFRGRDGRSRQSPEHAGFEMWVESQDGQVGGYIDRATTTPHGVVLSDYKSGAVLEALDDGGQRRVKETYRSQMELYAALYQSTSGRWPLALDVIPLQGERVTVAFTPEHAMALLADARRLLMDANEKIGRVQRGDADEKLLASPGADHCRNCLFRPACEAYWAAREQAGQKRWPHDIRGVLLERLEPRNGRVCLRITASDGRTLNVRNVSKDPARHPSLDSLRAGDRLAVYGLMLGRQTTDYSETNTTVICDSGRDVDGSLRVSRAT